MSSSSESRLTSVTRCLTFKDVIAMSRIMLTTRNTTQRKLNNEMASEGKMWIGPKQKCHFILPKAPFQTTILLNKSFQSEIGFPGRISTGF
jgi:hypothetical protein